ncbi:MAG: Rrf2 family transcriptional regulator, iron-sulfur cluster assembly transcription factor [Thermotogota bacterium]|nr:Rrf2 family transcriptional regulator, iron-sulfur cluster assembly transcription factor [Thermotogota bacterium]MDK2864616.1 Rrf2 family transcriptional regulator, iron-sulfur cluster assembly transcription factor [Thermotogota bacterium]HCZ06083.1 Rrf2 family transcriptional regulator [Thermotogota bacterium]
MGLTLKSGYGLRALVELAKAQEAGLPKLSVVEILERQDMPKDFLEKILGELRQAGIVETVRGRHGGYRLAMPASKITVKSVIDALETPMRVLSCIINKSCPRFGDCAVKYVWYKVNNAITRELSGMTLKDLMDIENRLKTLDIPEDFLEEV